MFGSFTTAADSLAAIDVRVAGVISQVCLEMYAVHGAPTYGSIELSFGSTSQFTSNDVTQVIATMAWTVTTAGVANRSWLVMPQLEIPVAAGERIYLHAFSNSNPITAARVYAMLLIEDKLTGKRR
jgi:hypothetical protein